MDIEFFHNNSILKINTLAQLEKAVFLRIKLFKKLNYLKF